MRERPRGPGDNLEILDTPGIDGVRDQAVDGGGGAEVEDL
jgi:hypothetical protein